jgi:U4/U6 small nuclear ribonucleoprotein PRP4
MPHIPLDLSNGVAPNGGAHGNGDVDMDSSEGTNPQPSHNGNGNAITNDNVNAEPTLPKSGLFLVTAGFDCNVRIWSADEWSLIRNLATDAGKVMSVDVSSDAKFIASASYSRSFHLFGGDHSL